MTPAQRRRQADWQRRVAAHPVSRSHDEVGLGYGSGGVSTIPVAIGVLVAIPLSIWGVTKLLRRK